MAQCFSCGSAVAKEWLGRHNVFCKERRRKTRRANRELHRAAVARTQDGNAHKEKKTLPSRAARAQAEGRLRISEEDAGPGEEEEEEAKEEQQEAEEEVLVNDCNVALNINDGNEGNADGEEADGAGNDDERTVVEEEEVDCQRETEGEADCSDGKVQEQTDISANDLRSCCSSSITRNNGGAIGSTPINSDNSSSSAGRDTELRPLCRKEISAKETAERPKGQVKQERHQGEEPSATTKRKSSSSKENTEQEEEEPLLILKRFLLMPKCVWCKTSRRFVNLAELTAHVCEAHDKGRVCIHKLSQSFLYLSFFSFHDINM